MPGGKVRAVSPLAPVLWRLAVGGGSCSRRPEAVNKGGKAPGAPTRSSQKEQGGVATPFSFTRQVPNLFTCPGAKHQHPKKGCYQQQGKSSRRPIQSRQDRNTQTPFTIPSFQCKKTLLELAHSLPSSLSYFSSTFVPIARLVRPASRFESNLVVPSSSLSRRAIPRPFPPSPPVPTTTAFRTFSCSSPRLGERIVYKMSSDEASVFSMGEESDFAPAVCLLPFFCLQSIPVSAGTLHFHPRAPHRNPGKEQSSRLPHHGPYPNLAVRRACSACPPH
ncbi:uncharacterized protein BDZ83DRAFT_607466 [Colletotrichum acutatum]|uniref:Uncharacterized protein n=1 Tax=Glomerella acutata TaxID=27357 RepID=A0AAD8XKB1_GLOAC|nr:uncharacterized protein BDZ83DRAFT_607466 [Colletotrichum acutatum]KAK1728923.1 hypothetical protein BDZ83DRAFT_607466 [Colletotrichum acutatum]